MPPQWMWPLPWEMEAHMDKVIAKRKARFGHDDDGDDADDAEMTENEFAKAWRD